MNESKTQEMRVTRIASWGHTAVMALIFLAIALRGAMFQSAPRAGPPVAHNALPLYAALIASELLLLYAMWRGIRRSGTTLISLSGGRWTSVFDVLRDAAIGAALWGIIKVGANEWDKWSPLAEHARSISPLLPQGSTEVAAWIVVSVVGGIVEELVFRGYFQRQFEAATQSRWSALALQALLFGVTHGYQGLSACIRITVIGALFGALAIACRSLRPGMIAHVWTDIASGAFRS